MKPFVLLYLLTLSYLSLADQALIADKVFTNGIIYTVDEANPWAQSIATKDGEIIFVGNNTKAKGFIGPETQLTDLKGKFLLPGFIDAHSHIIDGGAHHGELMLDRSASLEQWLAEIKEYADKTKGKKILMASGFLASAFGRDGPHKKSLDKILPNQAIYIIDEGMHTAWLNSAALELLGITADTPDPRPGFDYYKRDKNGALTGWLLEGTAWQALSKAKQINNITVDDIAEGTAGVIDLYNSHGITSVFDAGAWEDTEIADDVLDRLALNNDLSIRFHGSYYLDNADDLNSVIDTTLAYKKQTQNTPYKIDTLKILVDGVIEARTAAMFEHYQGEENNFGHTTVSADELNILVEDAVAKKLDIHFHAIGDKAVSMSLDSIERVQKNQPGLTSRFTISHVQVVADKDLERFGKLGVIAQGSLLWARIDNEGKAFLSADQFHRYYRFNSLLMHGAKLTFGCDFPAHSGPLHGIAPLYNMEVGHTRQNAGTPDAEVQPNIKERLNIASLIEGYTINGAYQLRLEDKVGSIEVGKKADLVLLNQNLFEVEPHKIHKVKVLNTWLNGELIYSHQ